MWRPAPEAELGLLGWKSALCWSQGAPEQQSEEGRLREEAAIHSRCRRPLSRVGPGGSERGPGKPGY